jgi:hypothetical protein
MPRRNERSVFKDGCLIPGLSGAETAEMLAGGSHPA